jgi:hypothetical protein
MPIIELQRRMRELGRIRTGQQVKSNGRNRPAKLETFRLTSPSRPLIDAAAEAYGGTVKAWNGEWELITETDALDVVIPPGQSISQWYEMWSGGGCQRRCDGRVNVLTDGPCLCPADPAERRELAKTGEACKPTTRLNVMLPAIPDLGVWRLESHGYYAATELAGTVDVIEAAGRMLPARLRLEQREVKRPGQPTNHFAVPVLELPSVRIADIVSGELPAGPVNKRERVTRPELPSGIRPPSERPETPAADAETGEFEEGRTRCAVVPPESPLGMTEQCAQFAGHAGAHRSREGSWPQDNAA